MVVNCRLPTVMLLSTVMSRLVSAVNDDQSGAGGIGALADCRRGHRCCRRRDVDAGAPLMVKVVELGPRRR